MKKWIMYVLIMVLIFSLTACSKPTTSESGTTPDATQVEVQTEAQAESAENAVWPSERMGTLTEPQCKIVSVTQYEADSMAGKLTIVAYAEMSQETAIKFLESLTTLGFADGVSLSGEEKIIFSGTANDQSTVNFDYDVKTKMGNISFAPPKM